MMTFRIKAAFAMPFSSARSASPAIRVEGSWSRLLRRRRLLRSGCVKPVSSSSSFEYAPSSEECIEDSSMSVLWSDSDGLFVSPSTAFMGGRLLVALCFVDCEKRTLPLRWRVCPCGRGSIK